MNSETRPRRVQGRRRYRWIRKAQVDELVAFIAQDEGIRPTDIYRAGRAQWYAWPRQRVFLELNRQGLHPQVIAAMFQKDRTTVLHGIAAAEARERQA